MNYRHVYMLIIEHAKSEENEVFNSIKDARNKYGKNIHISDVLIGHRKYAGELPDGTKLSWRYA